MKLDIQDTLPPIDGLDAELLSCALQYRKLEQAADRIGRRTVAILELGQEFAALFEHGPDGDTMLGMPDTNWLS